MIRLVPEWAGHYTEFWEAVKKRNLWFIKLRYGAFGSLIVFLLISEFILDFSLSYFQFYSLLIIAFLLLGYNLIFHFTKHKVKEVAGKFNVLHFSLIQILLDVTLLAWIVYVTGGIESPLLYLFIFHMIIGSLILPGKVVYSIAAAIVFFFITFSFLEYNGVVHHHNLSGFIDMPLYLNIKYIIINSSIFSFVIFMSVYFANGIAKQLYKLEQDLVESFEKLEQAEKEKQKYIMAVVHEIKAPLTAVITYLDIVLKKMLGPIVPEVEERLSRCFTRVNEAVGLINNVLRISKLRLLNEIVKEEFDLTDILTSLINSRKQSLEAKKIELKLVDERSEIKTLTGDKFLMEMVLSNLLSNAMKYTNPEGNIRIHLSNTDKDLRIKISDDGIGIPKQDLEKMFGDFFRASNAKRDGFEGTGLGLTIVKQVISKHNGTIEIDSPSDIGKEGRPGTTALIQIPY